MKTKEESINYVKCKEIVKTLNEYYKEETNLANIEFPKNIKTNSHEYYLYIFYSCLLNYGMRSKTYNQNLNNAYEKEPKLFCPSYINSLKESELKKLIINNIHSRCPSVATKKWMELSKQLIQYQDLPNYLKNIKSINELNKIKIKIKGYGQKTGNLLIRMIKDTNICDFKENIEAIPIDRHDIEISYLTGVIDKSKLTDKEIDSLCKS